MDVLATQQKGTAKPDTGTRSAESASADILAASFSDMLRNSGGRVDSNVSTLMAQVDRAIAAQQTEPAAQSNNSDFDKREDTGAGRSDSRDDRSAKSDRRDTDPADKASGHRDREEPVRDGSEESKSTRADDSEPARRTDGNEQANDTSRKDTAGSRDTDQTADRGADPANQTASAGDQAESAVATATDGNSAIANGAELLDDSTEIATATTATETVVADPAADNQAAAALAAQLFAANSQTGNTPVKAAAETTTAIHTLAGAVAAASDTSGQAKTATQGQQTMAQTNQQTTATNADLQALSQATAETSDKGSDTKAQQAATLSRMVGTGNQTSVSTTVTSEANTLVSRPSSALSAAAATVGEATKPTTTTAQSTTATAMAGPANAAETNPLASQAQQAAAQAAQTQSAAANNGAARGVGQMASIGSTGSGMTQAGMGESLTGTGPQPGSATTTQQSAQTQASNPQRFTLPRHAVVDQVSVQISKALQNGTDRINIQLRPEALGRVDIRMDVAADGRVSAVVTADNKDTLDMLQKDSRELERALQEAGLQADNSSLSFNLRGQNGDSRDAEPSFARGSGADGAEDTDDAEMAAVPEYEGGIRPDGRVDIRA